MNHQNSVELIDYMGSDKLHSLAAWASTFAEFDLDLPENIENRVDIIVNHILNNGKRKRSIQELLQFLSENEHTSPFRFSSFVFACNTDIATHIQKLKHRVVLEAENGECLTGDSIISFVNNNNSVSKKPTIEELFTLWENGRPHQKTEKDKIFTQNKIKQRRLRVLNENTGEFIISHIKDIWYKGFNDVYQIKLKNGKSIKCTENHAIYTKEGYKTIAKTLNVGDLVGCNGVSIDVEGKPYTFKSFFDNSEQFTRIEFANLKGCKYELIKKWGYIHDVNFKKDENKDFQKGHNTWNKDKTGYKINIDNRKHNPLKKEKSHFWRGGVSSERALIGAWTQTQASKVHFKYNYTCQFCGNGNDKLHAHHIIPVTTDIEKACDFDNLITVCQPCHSIIHNSIDSEKEFAKKVLANDFEKYDKKWSLLKKIPKKRKFFKRGVKKVHFSEIVSILCIGKEKTYDIEVEGVNNNFIANGIVVHNSARYKELQEDKFYLPKDWKGIEVSKSFEYDNYENGGSVFESVKFHKYNYWIDVLQEYTQLGNALYHKALEDLTPQLGKKRAKETARYFKTYNSQINTLNKLSFDGVMQFYFKRHDKSFVQNEIADLAIGMVDCIKNIPNNPFEHSLRAFKL